MWRRGAGRALLLFVLAFIAERVTHELPSDLWFVTVFAAVFLFDNVDRLRSSAPRPLFVEDIVLGILLYAGFGYLSSLLDTVLFSYTGKHASPAIPATILRSGQVLRFS